MYNIIARIIEVIDNNKFRGLDEYNTFSKSISPCSNQRGVRHRLMNHAMTADFVLGDPVDNIWPTLDEQ